MVHLLFIVSDEDILYLSISLFALSLCLTHIVLSVM